MANNYGLDRAIPAAVRRSVRQRCGFGCVICGASIYEYDHFDPPFAEATSHRPEGITLLCPTHHAERTRGVLPFGLLLRANAKPAARLNGYTSVERPYFDHVPSLAIGGGMLVQDTPIPLMVRGVPIIEFLAPEAGSPVARINATLTSGDGANLLRIFENEWIVENGVWDYEWVGRRMTIRDDAGAVALQITIFPPKFISIDNLTYVDDRIKVSVSPTEIIVNRNTYVDCVASSCAVGMSLG